jgi:hypothetical protein
MEDCTEIRVGDINVQMILNIIEDGEPVDLSTVFSTEILIRKPDGVLLTNSANFMTDGTDGRIYYNSVAGDFDQEGIHKIQARITTGAGFYQSQIKNFKVHGNI